MAAAVAPRSQTTARGMVGAGAAVLCFSVGPLLVKVGHLPGLTLAFYRLWTGFALMAILHLVFRGALTRRAVRLSALGGLLFGVNVSFFFSAVRATTVADANLITALQPALILLVAAPWFGEHVSRRTVLLTAVAIAGVALVVIGSSGTPVWSLRGDLLAVGALVTWAGYFVVSKRARQDLSALEYMAAVMGIAALVVTPIALVSGQRLGNLHGRDVLLLAAFVLVPGAGGHLLLSWSHRYVDVSVSSIIVVAAPVLSSLAAAFVLDEPLGALQLAGGLVVLVAIAAVVSASAATFGDHPETAVETATP
jgi:drug/metabolite transporter (DMT)-like permease